MLDPKRIRENPELVQENLEKRGDPSNLNLLKEAIIIDEKRRELIKKVESLKQKRNEITQKISELKGNSEDAESELQEAKKIGQEIDSLDSEMKRLNEEFRIHMMNIPNMLHESVPLGKDDTENVEVKREGELKFDFEPKNHVDLLNNLGLLDEDRATKTSGSGFVFIKEELALLDYSLMRFSIDFLRERGFILVEPPYMLTRQAYEGVTSLEDFESVMYKIDNEDLYLIATSEHALGAKFMNETLDEMKLPLKLAGVSPCFRREIGSHGKYTKGLFRMHQFNKIEQFVFSNPEDSWALHEEIQQNSEELLRKLGIAFRTVNVCTGDIGSIAAKKYDIEFLMADSQYREIGSNSNCTDYQARRLNVKYREKEGMPAKGFVHTLNNTAIATSRAMIAIIEQFQREDGSITIPDALQPYTGFKEIVKK